MTVCLDANIVIDLVERNPFWEPRVPARIATYRAAGDKIAVCDAARLECLVGPFQTGNPADLASYATFFASTGGTIGVGSLDWLSKNEPTPIPLRSRAFREPEASSPARHRAISECVGP
jgi:hypothetical protein